MDDIYLWTFHHFFYNICPIATDGLSSLEKKKRIRSITSLSLSDPLTWGIHFYHQLETLHINPYLYWKEGTTVIRFFWSKIISLQFPAWASALFKTSKNKSKFQRKLGAALYDKRLSQHITTSESLFCGCAFWIFIYSFGGIDNRQPSDSFNFLNHNLS